MTDTRNGAHGSDSDQSAKDEIEIVFPDFDFDQWKNKDYKYLTENFIYDENKRTHSHKEQTNINTLFGSSATTGFIKVLKLSIL